MLLSKDVRPSHSMVRESSGHLLSECTERLQRWSERFSQLFNRHPIQSACIKSPGILVQYEINFEVLSPLEIIYAVQKKKH